MAWTKSPKQLNEQFTRLIERVNEETNPTRYDLLNDIMERYTMNIVIAYDLPVGELSPGEAICEPGIYETQIPRYIYQN